MPVPGQEMDGRATPCVLRRVLAPMCSAGIDLWGPTYQGNRVEGAKLKHRTIRKAAIMYRKCNGATLEHVELHMLSLMTAAPLIAQALWANLAPVAPHWMKICWVT